MKAKKKNVKWRFFWKNVGGLGRLNRLAAGIAALALASQMKEDQKNAAALAAFGMYLAVVGGLLGWCSLRALLKRPTKRAFRRHFPEAAA